MKKLTLTLTIIFGLISFSGQSLAWHDKTHLAVAKVAGYDAWYNAAGADIARIANLSRKLGYRLAKEDRNMTPEEAYVQLGHSASLLKAVLQHYKRI
jgi:hypothetical protein